MKFTQTEGITMICPPERVYEMEENHIHELLIEPKNYIVGQRRHGNRHIVRAESIKLLREYEEANRIDTVPYEERLFNEKLFRKLKLK